MDLPSLAFLTLNKRVEEFTAVNNDTPGLVAVASGMIGGPMWQVVSRNDNVAAYTNGTGLARILEQSASQMATKCVEMIRQTILSKRPMGQHVQFGFLALFQKAGASRREWVDTFYVAVMAGLQALERSTLEAMA